MANCEIFIGLPELDALIQALEKKYGMSTAEFIRSRDECFDRVEEDDIFKWDTYITHRSELRRTNEELHEGYLSELKPQGNPQKSPEPEEQLALAA